MLNRFKAGLVFGTFLSLMHLIRAAIIAIFPAFMQRFLDRIFGLHFLQPVYILTPASRTKGIMLVVFTFIVGYIMGMIFACLRNKFLGMKKAKAAIAKPVAKKKRR